MKIVNHLIRIVSLLVLAAGCTIIPNKIEFKQPKNIAESLLLPCSSYGQYVIAADERGNLIPLTFEPIPDKKNKCNVRFEKLPSDSRKTETKKHIQNIWEKIKKSGKKPLIFIHGGLNDYEDSVERLARDIPNINVGGQYYPVFILWPSGMDTYTDSLFHYFQGEWDRPADTVAAPFKIITDLMQVPSRLLSNYATSYRLASNSTCYLETDSPFLNEASCAVNSWLAMVISKKNVSITNSSFIANDPCIKGNEKVGFHCVDIQKDHIDEFYNRKLLQRVFLLPAKLITIPVTDPLARRAWNSMIARIRFTFRTPCPADISGAGNCESGVVYQFFKALKDYRSEDDKKITLIGHSMGSIVAGEIIREFHELPYENVVFGGAAISIREFKNTVEATLLKKVEMATRYSELIKDRESLKRELSLLEKTEEIKGVMARNEKAIDDLKLREERDKPFKFYNLSLHPFAEAREENLLGLIPSGSLLEWIDQIIENPADGLDRTLGKWVNISPLLANQDDQPEDENFDHGLLKNCYMHFSRFGLDPKQPLKHTHFSNDIDGRFKYWKPENWMPDNKQCNVNNDVF